MISLDITNPFWWINMILWTYLWWHFFSSRRHIKELKKKAAYLDSIREHYDAMCIYSHEITFEAIDARNRMLVYDQALELAGNTFEDLKRFVDLRHAEKWHQHWEKFNRQKAGENAINPYSHIITQLKAEQWQADQNKSAGDTTTSAKTK